MKQGMVCSHTSTSRVKIATVVQTLRLTFESYLIFIKACESVSAETLFYYSNS